MSERLLRIEGGRLKIGTLRLGVGLAPHESALIAPELDRLYAAAEANQAPGPDWKAKLREEVEDRFRRTSGGCQLIGIDILALIDDLPDPHMCPECGGTSRAGCGARWHDEFALIDALPDPSTPDPAWCRDGHPTTLFEVRRVPAPEPATEWVPLTKLVGRTIKGETEPVHLTDSPNPSTKFPGWRWRPITMVLWQRFPDGTLDIDTGMVLVLAEGER